ncbi:nuclear-pore anchor-like [Magnolia sinica]|uniref:nuclear-pore anchor-like n=1 Tax=Magnolia sinica TaxID=86752 RepID=UPI00265AFEAF|nr:nuclear-pore anchor-like [Magnolia sinica]
MEKLKGEAQANKDHMLKYKEITQVNEVALKQIESAHEKFKAEANKLRKSLEDEIYFLKGRVSELESDLVSKSTKVTSTVSGKEKALSSYDRLSKVVISTATDVIYSRRYVSL